MTPLTLTERDVLGANAATGNVSTFSTETQLIEWRAGQRRSAPGEVEYLISARGIQTPRQRIEPTVSPAWFGRVKNGLKALVGLPVGWDTYGGLPADPRVAGLAAELIEWFAVVGVPPPDPSLAVMAACSSNGTSKESTSQSRSLPQMKKRPSTITT
jgi:hypothetical protein